MLTVYPIVTFAEFARVMRSRGIDPTYLVKRFRTEFGDGTAEVRMFFDQVFDRRYRDRMIPYRSVIEFFRREVGITQMGSDCGRRCACGCGQRVFGRKKWATNACKQRGYRRRVAVRAKEPKKAA